MGCREKPVSKRRTLQCKVRLFETGFSRSPIQKITIFDLDLDPLNNPDEILTSRLLFLIKELTSIKTPLLCQISRARPEHGGKSVFFYLLILKKFCYIYDKKKHSAFGSDRFFGISGFRGGAPSVGLWRAREWPGIQFCVSAVRKRCFFGPSAEHMGDFSLKFSVGQVFQRKSMKFTQVQGNPVNPVAWACKAV